MRRVNEIQQQSKGYPVLAVGAYLSDGQVPLARALNWGRVVPVMDIAVWKQGAGAIRRNFCGAQLGHVCVFDRNGEFVKDFERLNKEEIVDITNLINQLLVQKFNVRSIKNDR